MADSEFVIYGLAEMHRNTMSIFRDLNEAAGSALEEVASRYMDQMLALTPLDTGALRASAQVHPLTNSMVTEFGNLVNQKEIILSFGDDKVDYAIIVHENLTNKHPIGKNKFMERTIQSRTYHYENDIGRKIRL